MRNIHGRFIDKRFGALHTALCECIAIPIAVLRSNSFIFAEKGIRLRFYAIFVVVSKLERAEIAIVDLFEIAASFIFKTRCEARRVIPCPKGSSNFQKLALGAIRFRIFF